MLVHHLLEDSARHRPEAVALLEGKRSVSYAELDRLANRFGRVLRDAGVARHDRVVLAIENSVDLVAAYLGVMKAGAVAVPLPAGGRSDRLAAAVLDCGPSAAVIDAGTAHEIDGTHPLADPTRPVFVAGRRNPRAALPERFVPMADALRAASDDPIPVRAIDADLATIIYTSGSTGDPKGVMLTHRNIVANTRSIVGYLGLTARDRVMCVLPFYYVYGLSLLHTHLAVGGSVVIDNRFVFPNVVLNAMRQRAVTGFAGVPSTFALLLHRTELEPNAIPTLRYVTQAGGAMAPALVQKWLERGWQVPFYVMYGATEASARLTYLDPSRLGDKIGSIGQPIPGVEILVVREDGGVAAAGDIGELVARGSNVSRGYWNNPEETRRRFGPLGYRTGDLGYRDDEGFLFLVGRMHDMIKVGAHRVGAKEIEDVLYAFPGVLEAAVVAAPHDLLGETPVAFLSLEHDLANGVQGLKAFCRSKLPAHKVPTQFVILPDLPKLGPVGKLDKGCLRERARTAAIGAR